MYRSNGVEEDKPGPVATICFNGYMMYKLGWVNWARLIVWLIIGLAVYFGYSRHHSRVRNRQLREQ